MPLSLLTQILKLDTVKDAQNEIIHLQVIEGDPQITID